MVTRQINWNKFAKTVLLHLLFWMIIVSYFAWGFGLRDDPKRSFINASFFLPGFFLMVYTLLYWLVPNYLLRRKFLQFFLGLGAVLILCFVYTNLAQLSLQDLKAWRGMTWAMGRNVLPFLHVGGIALSIKLLIYWYKQKQQTMEAEKQKTAAELQLLKAQLHPHFLFNTLNNLYSHTLEASPKSPEIVMKLSELLRFMIYESNASKIPLAKEIKLIQNYITLEELRYGDRLDLSVSIKGEVEKYQITPFLLLPFLENAFKHGTSKQIDQCWISMDLTVKDSTMYFKLVNSYDPEPKDEPLKQGGLGLLNVQKRLELLYANRYRFETTRFEDVFVVALEVELEEQVSIYSDSEKPSKLSMVSTNAI